MHGGSALSLKRRFVLSVVLLVTLYSVGAAGYAVLEDVPPFDALYRTAITLGIAVFWIAFTSLVSAFVSGDVRNMMRSRKLQSEIDQAQKHVILCGYGRMGGPDGGGSAGPPRSHRRRRAHRVRRQGDRAGDERMGGGTGFAVVQHDTSQRLPQLESPV
ncbi:MAG: hypothetical protein IID39_02695 [Planctomycetes bacterium]|nr:hypothetical protein [Planctomycetota bacterium]